MGWLTRPTDDTPQLKEVRGSKTTKTQRHKRGRGVTTTTHDAATGETKSVTRYGWRDLFTGR